MRSIKVTGIASILLILIVMVFTLVAMEVSADLGDSNEDLSQFTQKATINAPVPIVGNSKESASTTTGLPTLCRIGYSAANLPLDTYLPEDVQPMRGGWLLDLSACGWHKITAGMRIAPSIHVKQWKEARDGSGLVMFQYDPGEPSYAKPYTYTVMPSIDKIKQLVAQHPGQLWLVGNEIERRDWAWYKADGTIGGAVGQGEILPEVYAVAYHEIYHAIKTADPTAQVANGSIILPSPLRLEYMTKMWDVYYALYDAPMPVDVWQIHLYLLQERRLDWGADIPAGSDAQTGLFAYDKFEEIALVNKDFSKVPDLVRAFRAWMKEHGQQNKPLIISEYGVNMPDWIIPGQFEPENIGDEFLIPSLNYFMSESDPELGYPADDNRLVQSLWWWSLDSDDGNYEDSTFYQSDNGNLLWSGIGAPTHSPYPKGLSMLGTYWIDYVSTVTDTVNLKPLRLEPQSPVVSKAGEPVTVSLGLLLSNAGNIAVTQPFSVTLTDADSSQELASFTVTGPVEGCGGLYSTANVLWLDVPPGAHTVLVTVDGNHQITETNEGDNTATFTVLVATHQIRLPVTLRR